MDRLKYTLLILIIFPTLSFADVNLYDPDFFKSDSKESPKSQRVAAPGSFTIINTSPAVKEKGGVFLEFGGRLDPNIAVARVGVYRTYAGWYSIMIGGEALSDDDDHTFGGATAGIRIKFPYFITPFAGVHFFAGTYEEEVDADSDGVDNDEDGAIDEPNEKKWVTEDTMAAFCPEVGLMIYMDKNTQLVLSAKHYYTDKGRDSDFWVYGVGINIVF